MSGTESVSVAYRYAKPSVLVADELSFATSGGVTKAGPAVHPYFFTGFLAEPGPAAQALLAISAIARAQYQVTTPGDGLRDPVVTTHRPGAACLAGPKRLAELRPLLRFTRRLRVYAPESGGQPAPSAWELTLGVAGARFTLTLSPEKYRGFSGEGALLAALGAAPGATTAAADADLISLLLGWDPVISLSRLTDDSSLPAERAVAALATLATWGKVGYDLADAAYFRRELPLGAVVERTHPRLADARSLVAGGQVILTDGGAMSSGHRVTFGLADPAKDTCTCPWWARYQGTRGPCKHVLAARIAARNAARESAQDAAPLTPKAPQ